jgi:hypothetical protein
MAQSIDDVELDSVDAKPDDRISARNHVEIPGVGGMGAVKGIFGPQNRNRLLLIGGLATVVLGSFAWSYHSIQEPLKGGAGEVTGGAARTQKNAQPTEMQREEATRYNEEELPKIQQEDPMTHPMVVTEDTGEFNQTRAFARPDKITNTGDTRPDRRSKQASEGGGTAQSKEVVPPSRESVDLMNKLMLAEGANAPESQTVSWAYKAPKSTSSATANPTRSSSSGTYGNDGYKNSGQVTGELPTKCQNPIIRAGHQYVARSTMALNSDVGGPVIVELVNGPLRKHRLFGGFERKDEWMRMEFQSVGGVKDPVKVNAIGLDMETVLNAVGGDVDYHTLYRYGWWGFGTVLSAIGKAAEKNSDQQTIFVGDSVVRDTASDTAREIKMALGDLGQSLGDVMRDRINRPLTVSLAVNDLVGIVFMEDVCGDK